MYKTLLFNIVIYNFIAFICIGNLNLLNRCALSMENITMEIEIVIKIFFLILSKTKMLLILRQHLLNVQD